MATVETKPFWTPEDLLAMPDGDRYELVDGQLVERPMGATSSYIGRRLSTMLGAFCEERRLGWIYASDCGYRCFPDKPRLVRRPDVSLIRLGRLPGEELPDGYVDIPPDLAVEVVSPNDLAYELAEKIEEYLGAGVRLVWIVNPKDRTVLIYRADGSIHGLREHDELSGEDVVPGFRCRVGDLFVNPFQADQTTEMGGGGQGGAMS